MPGPIQTAHARSGVIVLVVALWMSAAAAGLSSLVRSQSTAGAAAAAPASWPVASTLPHSPDSAALLLFLHPRCPCSRATLREMEQIVARSGGGIPILAVLTLPVGADSTWLQSSLCRQAAAIPGVTVQPDPDGAESARFGAFTSGQVLLYDERDHLQFAGGITPGRAHEGASAGRDALLALLIDRKTTASAAATPVFGCALTSGESLGERKSE